MKRRKSITFTEKQILELEKVRAEITVSFAEVIRQAVDEYLDSWKGL